MKIRSPKKYLFDKFAKFIKFINLLRLLKTIIASQKNRSARRYLKKLMAKITATSYSGNIPLSSQRRESSSR